MTAEEAEPTLDEVDSVIFSRPPYSQQVVNLSVYYVVSAVYVAFAILLLVGANLDAAERRERLARAIVPQESVSCKMLCCRVNLPQENVPCEITEQYYLDGRLLSLRNAEQVDSRKQHIGCCGYLKHFSGDFAEVLLREHLALSFVTKAIPTFTRVKRALLIAVQVHVCMLMGAMVFNIKEHNASQGRYEIFKCSGDQSHPCFATVPAAVLAALATVPVFRFAIFRQMRLTCFVSQSHPSTSRFPLGMRKFASLMPKTLSESMLCMRNEYDRLKVRFTQSRSLPHRVVHMLWQTTQSSIKDLRFYSAGTSWLILLIFVSFVLFTLAYVLSFTVYLEEAAVYHWLIWVFVMLACWILVFEPLWLLWTEVIWCAIVATVAQRWGYGSHALAATTKYKSVVKQVDEVIIQGLREVASGRIQTWWKGMLVMYKQIHEQTAAAARTAAAIKIQAVRKKVNQQKKFLKERKWCMRVDVINSGDFEEIHGEELSPFVRLKCDTGNTNANETKVQWGAGTTAEYHEIFFVDIKESNSMVVTALSKGAASETFIGRATFDFNQLKNLEEKQEKPQGHMLRLELSKSQNPTSKRSGPSAGFVKLRVTFLDPLKEQCGIDGQEDWMLPKNRMKFALSKMGPGGRLKVGKMLGSLKSGTPSSARSQQMPSQVPFKKQWVADNSVLCAKSAGIGYRKSKNLADPVEPPQAVLWGSTIRGEDEGDGWLKVAEGRDMVMFVPMELQGIVVLKQVDAGGGAAAASSAAQGDAGGNKPPKMPRPVGQASGAPTPQPGMPAQGVGGASTPTSREEAFPGPPPGTTPLVGASPITSRGASPGAASGVGKASPPGQDGPPRVSSPLSLNPTGNRPMSGVSAGSEFPGLVPEDLNGRGGP